MQTIDVDMARRLDRSIRMELAGWAAEHGVSKCFQIDLLDDGRVVFHGYFTDEHGKRQWDPASRGAKLIEPVEVGPSRPCPVDVSLFAGC